MATMGIDEYVDKAKQELDDLKKMFKESHEKEPEAWPLEMTEEEWGDQELSARFSYIP